MRLIYILFAISLINIPFVKSQSFVEIRPLHLPILKDQSINPIFNFKIQSPDKKTLNSISLNLQGTTDLSDIKSIELYSTGNDSSHALIHSIPIISQGEIKKQMKLVVDFEITDSICYLWISCQLQKKYRLTNTISMVVEKVIIDNNPLDFNLIGKYGIFRYGIALRNHSQNKVHTSRIPGLATSSKGTLLAIYDARRKSSRDLQGDIDIGLNRSFDGGETWEPMQTILDMDEWGDLPEKFNGVSDACILVNGDDIFVAGLWMHGVINSEGKWIENLNEDSTAWNHQWRNKGSQPGFSPRETSQFLITRSTDDGKSWNNPVNLTRSCKKEDWWLWAPAPGRGIVMDNGILVFPTQGRDENGLPFSNITYSKDNGLTWNTSNPASSNTTECSVAEIKSGELMLNIRDNRNRQNKSETNGRAVFTTKDLGETWSEHPSSHQSLIEPVCMASLLKHKYSRDGKEQEVLLFSNPNSKYHRSHQTIKMSFDGGDTWPEDKWILLDEGKGRGYSCITSIDEHTIGIIYEGSRADLIFQKIDLSNYL